MSKKNGFLSNVGILFRSNYWFDKSIYYIVDTIKMNLGLFDRLKLENVEPNYCLLLFADFGS